MLSKIVVITGGSSGIGKQLAADLLRRGDVVGILSHDRNRLLAAEEELRSISKNIVAVVCDVTKQEEIDAAFNHFFNRFGRIDVLVNNAGWATYRTFEESSLEELLAIVDANFLGVVRASKAVLPRMIARRAGHIVNVSSIAGRLLITPNSAYTSSKHAVVALSEAMRHELHRFNIHISVVCPGRVETPFFDHETFRLRAPRRETSITVSLEEVSAAIIRSIDRKSLMTFVPKYWAIVCWFLESFPWILRPIYSKLLLNRIESIYSGKQTDREQTDKR
ncbi:MAG: SDR family NAD(P)-dependent oxidoreductase [Verrucomicrobiota bacterium]